MVLACYGYIFMNPLILGDDLAWTSIGGWLFCESSAPKVQSPSESHQSSTIDTFLVGPHVFFVEIPIFAHYLHYVMSFSNVGSVDSVTTP